MANRWERSKKSLGYFDSKTSTISRTDLPVGTYYKYPYFPLDPQCIIANFCISSGKVFGGISSSNPNNASFVIDYIRVYELSENIQSGYEDLCNFKLTPIGLLCTNSSQSITINSNKNNFKSWASSNATLTSTTNTSSSFTPISNGIVKIEATASDFCTTKNIIELWYGKPKHTIKIEPYRCTKCWKVYNSELDIMQANFSWKIGVNGEYLTKDCTGTTTYSIPAKFTSINTCGTYTYSTNIVSSNVNCGGNSPTQITIPINSDYTFRDIINKRHYETFSFENSKINLYTPLTSTLIEINDIEAPFNNFTRTKGFYILQIQNRVTGVSSFIKLILF